MLRSIDCTAQKPAFKGMAIKDLKKFVPELTDAAAYKISNTLEEQLPNDILQVSSHNENVLIHLIKTGAFKLPIGEVRYSGSNKPAQKLNFIHTIAEKIKSSTLY